MPPGSRRPSVAASRPSCLPCRHVAAFRTKEPTRRPCSPRPIGPQTESRHSRTACRPRRLRRQSDLHCLLVVLRPQVATVARASGSAALLPFRVPAGPSAVVVMPPIVRATRNPLHPPLPAASCGRGPRLRRSPRPQNAVPYSDNSHTQQQPTNTPIPQDCLILRMHSGSISKVCASRTFVLNYPLGALWSPQGDRPAGFAAARGSRAGERLQNKAGEVSPDPSYCARESCRRRIPPQSVCASSNRVRRVHSVSVRAAGVPSPAVRFASIGRAVCAGLTRRWGRPGILLCNVPETPRNSSQVPSDAVLSAYSWHLSRRATPCLSALLPLRPACRKARATAVRGTVGSRCSSLDRTQREARLVAQRPATTYV